MFENIYKTTTHRNIVADFPDGAFDHNLCRALFKRVLLSLSLFFARTHLWVAFESETGKRDEVASVVCYDSEEDRVTITPVDIGRSIIRVGNDDVFMAHPRAVTLLTRKLIDFVSNMQTGAVAA